MKFDIQSGRVLFGRGRLSGVGPAARSMGNRAMVVTGAHPERAGMLLDLLRAAGLSAETFGLPGEPRVEDARRGAEAAREAGCDLVIGFGGGSALDGAKAVAGLAANPGDALDYLEVVGAGRALEHPALPCIAIPTTAGTGAEATRNAVLSVPEQRVKVSLRHESLLPRLAVIDPELTVSAPRNVTAASGMDALVQLIEPFVSCRANPFTDALCREGLSRVGRSLRSAWQDGGDLAARENMCLASLFSGMALAGAGLGAVHGIAGPFGGMFPAAPHGAVCARLLGPVMSINAAASDGSGPTVVFTRLNEVAVLIAGRAGARAPDGIRWVEERCTEFGVPGLATWGLTESGFDDLAERAGRASSMKGNPVALSREELLEIFRRAL